MTYRTKACSREIPDKAKKEAAAAFDAAIESGRLSDDPAAPNYAGAFMYMGPGKGGDAFKHIMTREYLPGGPIWDTKALQRDYTVQGFQAPFVVVVRKADGIRGSLEFWHSPRIYFNFQAA